MKITHKDKQFMRAMHIEPIDDAEYTAIMRQACAEMQATEVAQWRQAAEYWRDRFVVADKCHQDAVKRELRDERLFIGAAGVLVVALVWSLIR